MDGRGDRQTGAGRSHHQFGKRGPCEFRRYGVSRPRRWRESPMASIRLSRYEAEEGDLPEVCMCCGAPATERKRRRFVSHPLWVYVLMPFGYLPYVIVAAVLTEHVRCYTLFCPRHKNHWRSRTLIFWCA